MKRSKPPPDSALVTVPAPHAPPPSLVDLAEPDARAEVKTRLATLTRKPAGTWPPPVADDGCSRAQESTPTWIPDPERWTADVVDHAVDSGVQPADEDEAAATMPATQDVVAAFLAQATELLRRQALRYARRRAALVRQAGRRVDRLYAEELVQDALTDTWAGTAAWDPSECSLRTHLRREIRKRSWLDVRRARRFHHHRLDEVPRVDDPRKKLSIEEEMSFPHGAHASQGDLGPILIKSVARAAHAELRRMAAGNRPMLAILDCWATGVVDRADILDRTGLSEEEYRLARRTLTKLVECLSPELQEDANDLLRRAS